MTTIGEIAFQLVYDRIHNKESLPKRELLLTPELIIRESCQPNYQKI
jgi:LacI family transcriptional regulator